MSENIFWEATEEDKKKSLRVNTTTASWSDRIMSGRARMCCPQVISNTKSTLRDINMQKKSSSLYVNFECKRWRWNKKIKKTRSKDRSGISEWRTSSSLDRVTAISRQSRALPFRPSPCHATDHQQRAREKYKKKICPDAEGLGERGRDSSALRGCKWL